MATAKPAVVALNVTHAFAQHLLLMVPVTEGTGQPGIVRGDDGVSAGAPTTTTWTASAGTWSTNTGGACLHNTGSNPLQIGDVGSGGWLPTADCTVCVVRGRSGGFPSSNYAVQGVSSPGATAFGLVCPRNNGNIQWRYGATVLEPSGNPGYASDPPDCLVVTAGAAGMAVYFNGVKKGSTATAVTRSSSTTALSLMVASETQDFNFFQISAMQWDDATAIAWCADPYAHLVLPVDATAGQLAIGGVG